jgi:diguanylate cyclase (GGDEF)-like protein
MPADLERRKVLVMGSDEARRPLREVFADELLEEWEAQEVDSFAQARFVLQHERFDALLVDESVFLTDDVTGLAWLSAQQRAPVLLLASANAELATAALERGVNQWLLRGLALSHPPLLSAALHQIVQLSDLRRRALLIGEALHDCRKQVSRLVGLLWDASPIDARTRWATQRHMMERLEEEVARSDRHGTPLAVILGEVEPSPDSEPGPDAQALTTWTAERICRAKRRQDVAGQYGPHGFMLLLGHTSEAGAVTFCRRLQNLLQHGPAPENGLRGRMRAHFGVAEYSETSNTGQALLSRAEERLEQARIGSAALALSKVWLTAPRSVN